MAMYKESRSARRDHNREPRLLNSTGLLAGGGSGSIAVGPHHTQWNAANRGDSMSPRVLADRS